MIPMTPGQVPSRWIRSRATVLGAALAGCLLAGCLLAGCPLAGCRGEPSTIADGTSSAPATSSDLPSSTTGGVETTNDSSSDGPDDELLCTDGPLPVWCFERRELPAGNVLLDLDGDGLEDGVLLSGDGMAQANVAGYRNTGDATLEPVWTFEVPFVHPIHEVRSKTSDLAARVFIGSSNELDTPLVVQAATGTQASLEMDIQVAHDNWTFGAFALFDANNDDIEDVVIIANGAARMLLLLGTADADFDPQPEMVLDDAVFGSSGWAVGDVDGDDNTDLLTSRAGSLGLGPTVYFGDGAGGFTDIVDVPADGRWPAFVVDVNGDGRGDVLTPTAHGFAVAYSEQGRTFRVVEQGLGEGPLYNSDGFFFIPADLDHDGSVEIVGFQDDMVSVGGAETGYEVHYEARLHVYSDLGEDGFATDRSVLFEDDCDRHVEDFAPADRAVELDGDGEPDFVFRWTTFCPEDFTHTTLGLLYRPQ